MERRGFGQPGFDGGGGGGAGAVVRETTNAFLGAPDLHDHAAAQGNLPRVSRAQSRALHRERHESVPLVLAVLPLAVRHQAHVHDRPERGLEIVRYGVGAEVVRHAAHEDDTRVLRVVRVRAQRARGRRARGSVVEELLARVAGDARFPPPRDPSLVRHRQLGSNNITFTRRIGHGGRRRARRGHMAQRRGPLWRGHPCQSSQARPVGSSRACLPDATQPPDKSHPNPNESEGPTFFPGEKCRTLYFSETCD